VKQLNIAEAETWRQCIQLFDDAAALPALVPVIPSPPSSTSLPCEVYDTVLQRLAAVSPGTLRDALDRWPIEVYSADSLMRTLREALPTELRVGEATKQGDSGEDDMPRVPSTSQSCSQEELLRVESLAFIHEAQGDHVCAAQLLMSVGSELLFPFLTQHLLAHSALRARAGTHLQNLFNLNPGAALQLFVGHTAVFAPQAVVDVLEPCGHWWQHRYLRLLLDTDPAAARPFRELLISLVAELEPHNLCSLLEELFVGKGTSVNRSDLEDISEHEEVLELETIQAPLAISQAKGIVDAEAWLLAHTGRQKDALRLLLTKLSDVQGALQLLNAAPASKAPELWKELVNLAMQDSHTYVLLLHYIGRASNPPVLNFADKASLVRQMPRGFSAPSLPSALAGLIQHAEDQCDAQELTLRQLDSMAGSVSLKLFNRQRRGVAVVPPGVRCQGVQATNTPDRPSLGFSPVRRDSWLAMT